ncbi:MAG: thiol:disulfide interchange protein DsbA/DsbL [Burkholderiales bacterium]|nr:MAG: thiol:disulfide interchange protein DsbA/DsbL [Burkholderiales bacterium]
MRNWFSARALALLASFLLALPAAAQRAPQLGREYREVKPVQATSAPEKIEVIEFFWYGCPHCNALEPALQAWIGKQADDVVIRKVPAGFRNWRVHQQMFYALEAMDKVDALHAKIFRAIHVNRNPLANFDQQADFVAANGVDRKAFAANYKSFTVATQMQRANKLVEAYGLDGVPAFAVNGKYFTAPAMAGGNVRVLEVLDYLIERERKAAAR